MTERKFKSPMLAVNAWDSDLGQLVQLSYPLYASPKLDGVRGCGFGGKLLTRSGKPFKNVHVNFIFSNSAFDGLDGELIVGKPNDPKIFQKTSGPLRRADGMPDVKWYLFDDFNDPTAPFISRIAGVRARAAEINEAFASVVGYCPVEVLEQVLINNEAELLEYEAKKVAAGYEGVMVRKPEGEYKHGRSTLNQGWLLKVKRFVHSEAKIIGYEQEYENTNEAFLDELGRTKRSTAQEGMVPVERLAKFLCESDDWNETFAVSCTSMTHAEREKAWQNIQKNPDHYNGEICRFKHFPHGAKDRPRHGLYDGIRDESDMSEVQHEF